MDCAVSDRRLEERVPNCGAGIARATLRPGCPVLIVDVSPGGALVQADRPLRPGARVYLHIATPADTFTLPALVLRCSVWSLGSEGIDGVTCRGAVQFQPRWEEFPAPDQTRR